MSEYTLHNPPSFNQAVLRWYRQHGRKHLPWQQSPTPYRVWVSEIMLQQTQVQTVIDYYLRFMERFPTIQALSQSHIDEVLALWTGLGYYARARNLHKCAQILADEWQGEFPSDVDTLCGLPGIGRSTAGAILALSGNIRAPILDGNVKRVLARLHCVEGWPGHQKTQKQLWQIADHYTPTTGVREYTQAMMDLGATLCKRKPLCDRCPVSSLCSAFSDNTQTQFPEPKPKKHKPQRETRMLLFTHERRVLLEKRQDNGIWGGLWSLPECDASDEPASSLASQSQRLGIVGPVTGHEVWPAIRHQFSHYTLTIEAIFIEIQKCSAVHSDRYRWLDLAALDEVGLAAPVKHLLDQAKKASGSDLNEPVATASGDDQKTDPPLKPMLD